VEGQPGPALMNQGAAVNQSRARCDMCQTVWEFGAGSWEKYARGVVGGSGERARKREERRSANGWRPVGARLTLAEHRIPVIKVSVLVQAMWSKYHE